LLLRIAKFIALAYLVTFCQTILANLTAINGIVPNYANIIIFVVIMRVNYRLAFPAVFMIGLLVDVLNPNTLGIGLAIRFGLAVVVEELKRKMDTDQLATRLYLLLGFEAAFQLLYQPLVLRFDFTALQHVLIQSSIPTFIYTGLVGALVVALSDLRVKFEVSRRGSGREA
jgi:cell shape-determining protein MreD